MTYSATVVTVNASGSVSNNGTKQMYKTGIGTTTAYTVTVTLTDTVGNTVSRSVYVPTIEIPFVIDPTLPAIGVGAVPQTARTLELASNWGMMLGKGIIENLTNDILADAMSQAVNTIQFYRGSGSSYTGTVPHSNFGYGSFIVMRRASYQIMVLAFSQSSNNGMAMNSSMDGSTWVGWRWWGNRESSLGTTSNYTKLSDGTMIQWGTESLTSMSLTQIGSSGIYYASKAITFPQAFTNVYYTVSGASRYSTGHAVPLGFVPTSASQTTLYIYDYYARSGTITARWQAVGRWQ